MPRLRWRVTRACLAPRRKWSLPSGRLSRAARIHPGELGHTAACLWLARGVDLATVQSWMGHASIATTNIYLHHMGTGADEAGLDRLNSRGHTWGTRGTPRTESQARKYPAFPAFPLVRRGLQTVELRGFEPLTFSVGAEASHLSSNLAGSRRKHALACGFTRSHVGRFLNATRVSRPVSPRIDSDSADFPVTEGELPPREPCDRLGCAAAA